jgi:photosystem II stability/assembly factor-like uncharacterized protein
VEPWGRETCDEAALPLHQEETMSSERVRSLILILTVVGGAPSLTAQARPQGAAPDHAALAGLTWRSIGPANMGGRVTDILGIRGDRDTFYVAGADGGLFKTTNAGTTFEALFTDQGTYSVGAIALAPSDHSVIWLGTGEGDPRNSASFGDGVYRSTDGGRTWTHLGLAGTERIKRIVVHPRDPDVALVCAVGHAWGPNEERGVFRTTDGGKTWEKVLYRNPDTGCSDLAMDPSNPRILYAGVWTFRRRAWHFTDGGGETALYQSADGGTTWRKLTAGLPSGAMARIGIAVAASRPSTVYMITETKSEGVLFRSDDYGESWRKVHDDPNINFRPFYYSDIRVDPQNPERVYSLSGGLYLSNDGGRTFTRIAQGVHGDHQALWIDPENPDRLLSGSDGGFQVSQDGGRTFEIINTVALSQFYHVFYDLRQPYYVCGGLQDNGNWCGPSRTPYQEGIRKDDWYTVSGGDGFYAVPVPTEPHLVYSNSQGGMIVLTDLRTGSTRSVHPYPNKIGSAGDAIVGHRYRYNWDSPIHVSPHDPGTVYFGANILFKSTDYGHSWEAISPDLTTDDSTKQQSSGGPIYVDNTAAEFHTTILTIAESPVTPGVIWVGTDDGNVQVTRDGGKTWTNVAGNIRGLAPNSWIARIEASWRDAGTAYVAVDRHREDDFAPHVFKTTDFGRTWTSLRGDLPALGYAQVIREDPSVPDLLYVGTEVGIFASWDGGRRWISIRNGLPPVSVRDIKVHPQENDLIIGTHGRGAFILDDLTPLQQIARASGTDAHLFPIRPAVRWQLWGRDAALGQKTYAAENPPYGALISVYLRTDAADTAVVTVRDATGAAIRTIRRPSLKAGLNRFAWDLRYDGPSAAAGDAGGGGFGGRFGGAAPLAVPGDYTVTIAVGGRTLEQPVKVLPDPRMNLPAADYLAQLEAAIALRDLVSQVNGVIGRTESLRRQLTELQRSLAAADSAGRGAVRRALADVNGLRDRLTRPLPGLGYRQTPRLREELNTLAGAVMRPLAPPTVAQKQRLEELTAEAAQVVAAFDAIVAGPVAEVNRVLRDRPLVVAGRVAEGSDR